MLHCPVSSTKLRTYISWRAFKVTVFLASTQYSSLNKIPKPPYQIKVLKGGYQTEVKWIVAIFTTAKCYRPNHRLKATTIQKRVCEHFNSEYYLPPKRFLNDHSVIFLIQFKKCSITDLLQLNKAKGRQFIFSALGCNEYLLMLVIAHRCREANKKNSTFYSLVVYWLKNKIRFELKLSKSDVDARIQRSRKISPFISFGNSWFSWCSSWCSSVGLNIDTWV